MGYGWRTKPQCLINVTCPFFSAALKPTRKSPKTVLFKVLTPKLVIQPASRLRIIFNSFGILNLALALSRVALNKRTFYYTSYISAQAISMY